MFNITNATMPQTINDITVEELKQVIQDSVKEILDEYLEDIAALSSRDYISSVREARQEYSKGETTSLEELMNV